MIIYSALIITLILVFIGLLCEFKERKNNTFYFLVFASFFAQLFILKPGHFANYDDGSDRFYSIFGTSLSTLIFFIFVLYIFLKLLKSYINKKQISIFDFSCLIIPIMFLFYSLIVVTDKINVIIYFAKCYFPIIFSLFLYRIKLNTNYLKNTFYSVNILLISQIILCRLIEGKFAASIFYPGLPNEFFGYYNSPHPLAASFCLFSFIMIYMITKTDNKKEKIFNYAMFFADEILIFLLNVTSYIFINFMMVSLFVLFLLLKNKTVKENKLFRNIILLVGILFPLIIVAIFNSRILENINNNNLTNGRLSRWIEDLNYFINNFSIFEMLFGKGFYSIYIINNQIGNGTINSLNIIIDMLFDVGIIGCIILILIFIKLLLKFKSKRVFYIPMIFFIIFAGLFNNIIPYVTVLLLFFTTLYYFMKGDKLYEFRK